MQRLRISEEYHVSDSGKFKSPRKLFTLNNQEISEIKKPLTGSPQSPFFEKSPAKKLKRQQSNLNIQTVPWRKCSPWKTQILLKTMSQVSITRGLKNHNQARPENDLEARLDRISIMS